MQQKIIAGFLILTLVLIFPHASAQLYAEEQISQKAVQVTIDREGNVKVTHEINNLDEQKQLELIKGTVSNLQIMDQFGKIESIKINEEYNSITISPNQGELTVQYDLEDVLILKDDIWTLDFRYLHTTNFFFPDELGSLVTNGVSVNLNDKKGLACYGCQIVIEYSIDEPKSIKQVSFGDKKFLVEIITFAEIDNFNFNQDKGEINFEINNEDQFVTTIIPLELLREPFTVFLNNEKIIFTDFNSSETHAWIKIKPTSTGEVTINGTMSEPTIDSQVITIIALASLGVIVIIAVFVVRKFSRH